jgi:hypothetical protein
MVGWWKTNQMNLYNLHSNPEKLKYYDQISSKLDGDGAVVFKNAKDGIYNDADYLNNKY